MKQPKITRNNYYEDKHYWTASFVKSMYDCPARAIAELNGEFHRDYTTALLVGNYVDTFLDGKIAFKQFVSEHPEIFNSRTGEVKADFKKADEMIARAQRDDVFMSYLRGQRQKIILFEIDGIPFKSKIDFYIKNKRIVDLKTVKDFDPLYREGNGRISFVEAWLWTLQMAIYQYGEGNHLPTYLACISKQDIPDLRLIEIPQYTLDAEMDILRDKLPYFDAMRQGLVEPTRCGKCAYCRATNRITAPILLDELIEY